MSGEPAAALHEPWDDRDRQREAMLFGLWIFLASEILFFGGLFLMYAYARHLDWPGFSAGARRTDTMLGTINTVVLLTSSLTIAVGERAIRAGWPRLGRWGLIITALFGLAFLGVKGLEYRQDVQDQLWPGGAFRFSSIGATQFWDFYWTITVVHALHLSCGIGFVGRLIWLDRKGELARRWMGAEVTTVYWHLVDAVWIILYPLIYLVGRGQ